MNEIVYEIYSVTYDTTLEEFETYEEAKVMLKDLRQCNKELNHKEKLIIEKVEYEIIK